MWPFVVSGCDSTTPPPVPDVDDTAVTGDTAATTTTTTPPTGDTAGPVPACAWRYADASTSFALPTAYSTYASTLRGPWLSQQLCGVGATWSSEVVEVTGDGFPDLLVTEDGCDPSGEVGHTRWTLHPGGAAGFADEPVPFPLPARYHAYDRPPQGTRQRSGDDACSPTASWVWGTLDLTGDRVLDLWVASDGCDPDPDLGAAHWNVYPGGATGLASTALSFGLPAGLGRPTVTAEDDEIAVGGTCGPSQGWSSGVLDLTGDGLPDLVVTRDDCDPGGDIGTRRWVVHAGTGDRFADAGEDWVLPTAYAARTSETGAPPFAAFENVLRCTSQRPFGYDVLDLTGDRVPDFVVRVDGCTDPTVGEDHWLVYPGGPVGFADSPIRWELPASMARYGNGSAAPFATASGAIDCQDRLPWRYETPELDGDPAPELVVLQDGCGDAALGTERWAVFPGVADGFPEPARSWALPARYRDHAEDWTVSVPSTVGVEAGCGWLSTWSWHLRDLTGDAVPDLVVSLDECGDPSVGTTHWNVHPAECEAQ